MKKFKKEAREARHEGKALVSLFFGLLFVLISTCFAISLISFVFAVNETEAINNAYKWLENSVKGKWQTLETVPLEASILALAYNSEMQRSGISALRARGFPGGDKSYCFAGISKPINENDCKIKETALASFVYLQLGMNNEKINEFLLNRSSLFKDISWFLQIDVERGTFANCTVEYDNIRQNITIYANKSVSVSIKDRCFSSYNQYWIKIDKGCYDKDFYITCQVSDAKPYKTTFLYKENEASSKWYVSSASYSVASGDGIDISVKEFSKCLADLADSKCDYEANAIAAYVLKLSGNEEYKNLIPYLKIMEKTNEKVNSYAWLLLLGDIGYADLVKAQQKKVARGTQSFWTNSDFGQFYDTAINAYSLIKANIDFEIETTKKYLLETQTKAGYWQCEKSGCNAIRDTAMLLYVFWPKGVPTEIPIAMNDCEAAGGVCSVSCEADYIEHSELNFVCGEGMKCCIPTSSISCESTIIGGVICEKDETCEGDEITAAEGRCCIGKCIKVAETCESLGGYLCDNTEDEYCPLNEEIPASDVEKGLQCCNIYCESCEDLDGKKCEEEEECRGYSIGDCCIGDCVSSKKCAELDGTICDRSGWVCEGRMIETSDSSKCCIGNCTKTCAEYGGEICKSDQKCDGDIISASDLSVGEICCIGTCKEKSRAWIIIVVILLLALIGAGLYFFVGKTKIWKKPKPPAIPPTMPSRPGMPPSPALPIPPVMPSKKIPPITPKPIPSFEEKKKTKEEEEFEKAMEKIKKITKK